MSDITITNLRKSFGPVDVLKGIDLQIKSGEFVVFVGPSGCGKSTLLRSIAGLEAVTSGSIAIDGQVVNDMPPSQRRIAMVFQTYALYPHMTVAENMAYALRIAKMPKAARDSAVAAAAETLHLGPYLQRKPKDLSGGQRQRVAIGRAIVRNPKVFLFDEPLSNLDAALRLKMRIEISRLGASLPDTTMIYVTHDQVEAMTMADRIVVLKDGEVQQVGTPMELYNAPQSLFVAQFIGSPKMNILTGAKAASFPAHYVGVRPEHLELAGNGGGAWTGTAVHSESLGADSFVYLDIGEDELLTVRLPGTAHVPAGTTLSVSPKARHYHLFDPEGRAIAA
ncbi:ABC transporter ATP-binding protein [Paragemmobacter straminiformis]|uniref:sn-glycerol-3-phosphate ABC transporter ATP-binding protein UgpC n=1 Tax=Paragemmobacter straminiformis TaxID=2045119 RepID=A0A842I428_9RHOB|nr:sn-glycerol-3-phosphate ABC transporter ATP-binding protein UgpC [Gemmobacter straminiformis]MBC2834600.1 sn-glycerol-3-phosphate ABC transporter ATP-binding protein UgpC [Gemmobacter straminiformis]